MKTHARYFVSERFGKSTVTLELRSDTSAIVAIDLPCPEPQTVVFTFEPQRVAQMMDANVLDPDAVMRIAIGQAHKLFILQGGRKLFGATLQLAVGSAPWIGELSERPSGAATVSCTAADANHPSAP